MVWSELERVLDEKWSITYGGRFERVKRELEERFGVSLELVFKQINNAVFLFRIEPPTERVAELIQRFSDYLGMNAYLGLFTAANVDVYRADERFADVLPFEKFMLSKDETTFLLVPLLVVSGGLYIVLVFEC